MRPNRRRSQGSAGGEAIAPGSHESGLFSGLSTDRWTATTCAVSCLVRGTVKNSARHFHGSRLPVAR